MESGTQLAILEIRNEARMKKITYIPIEQFLMISKVGHRGPDPVPKYLFLAAVLFVFAAAMSL
jgi:hypothetical protein